MKITEIDKNFIVETKIGKTDIEFHSVDSVPFAVYGVFKENGMYRRLPEEIAKTVSESVYGLHANTAGGRVKFVTDSPYVAISAKMSGICRMSHFALTGAAGFDAYDEDGYLGTFIPPYDLENGYESVIDFSDTKLREITINLPLYSNVSDLYIGVREGSKLLSAKSYKNEKPVVFYGSSITQGGCASRPGNSYQAIISRKQNLDYINLGFSGSACAEDEIAEYIAGLDMSAFVYDYDYNAPSIEHLEKTHEKMFDTIRKAQPKLPIIMVTRPGISPNMAEVEKRREIVRNTYETALKNGDENVYFINGDTIFSYEDKDMLTCDGVHPNDFGFWCMSEVIGKKIEEIWK